MNDTVVIDSISYSSEAIQYVTLDHKSSLHLECEGAKKSKSFLKLSK